MGTAKNSPTSATFWIPIADGIASSWLVVSGTSLRLFTAAKKNSPYGLNYKHWNTLPFVVNAVRRVGPKPVPFRSVLFCTWHLGLARPTISCAPRIYLVFSSMRYRWVFVRTMSESPSTAGEAMQPASSLFSASFLNSRPAWTTTALPDVLKK